MSEKFIPWQKEFPIRLSSRYRFISVADIIGSFTIFLSNDVDRVSQVAIVFEQSVDGHQGVYHEQLIAQRRAAIDIQLGEHFSSSYPLFRVENSEYLQRLSKQSYEVWNTINDKHFLIIADEAIIDVFSSYEPKIMEGHMLKINDEL